MGSVTGRLGYAFLFVSWVCFGQLVSVVPRERLAHRAEREPSTFRLDVKLIEIPVSVKDLHDRPVLGLAQGGFRLFEDGAEQQIVAFSRVDAPVSAGLVFDSSGSMRHRIQDSRAAVEQFLKTSMPGDDFSLVTFADKPELAAAFTPDFNEISRRLAATHARGWTAMNDAIRLSIEEMRRAANPRRVLLVLSDGGDNNSRYSEGELLSLVRESDVRVYAIGLFERPKFLEKLADETGGGVIWVRNLNDLPDAMDRLSAQIRNEYSLGYYSDHAQNDGKYHKVKIEVKPPDARPLQVSWRRGYTAP